MMLSVEVFAQYHHYVEAGSTDVSSTDTSRTTHHAWVHTNGAGHISGPFSFFAFAVCCIGGGVRGRKDWFKGVRQKLNAYNMTALIRAY